MQSAFFFARGITSHNLIYSLRFDALCGNIAKEIVDLLENNPTDKTLEFLKETIHRKVGKSQHATLH